MADVHGILLLDKPLKVSSAGAVARAKRLYRAAKAGHTGSLDPLATGLLPICFGEATKFGAPLLDADKAYRVTVRLGERTASADRESPVIERRELPPFTHPFLEAALAAFPRRYEQTPPMHSALKQEGKPLYEYARAGIVRERAPRTILIHELRLLDWQPPELSFDVRCTKGAYIRVLAEDLAKTLGTIGHLALLHRLTVSPFESMTQWTFEELEGLEPGARMALLLPVDAALAGAPRVDLARVDEALVRQGQRVVLAGRTEPAAGPVRMYSEALGFLGLGELEPGGSLRPTRLISAQINRA
jgi:tRNA pseudouridine55 synthase